VIRAYVHEPDRLMARVEVSIVDHRDDQPERIMRLGDGGAPVWETLNREAAIVEPTLTLPAVAGRALLDALALHYKGAEDTRQLRRDYDAERTRVDAQAAVLADVVRALASRTL
jgi:hypothetical protein